MGNRRNALFWAIGWWILRRQVRRKANATLHGLGVAAKPSGARRIVGALLLVGILAGAFVAWRRLAGDDGWGEPSLEAEPAPEPSAPAAA